jgi:hypothetical protein
MSLRRFASGSKGSVASLATGGGVGALSGYALSAVPWLGQAWWTMPTALALLGHFLKRKNPTIGGALLGVSGYWAYTGFMANKATTTAKGFIDAGFIDAGAVGRYAPGGSDAGALGGVSYNDNIGTAAAPALGTAQAAMLMGTSNGGAMGYDDSAELLEAYGLSD